MLQAMGLVKNTMSHCADNTTLEVTANMHDDCIHIVHYYNEDRPQEKVTSVENATKCRYTRLWPGALHIVAFSTLVGFC